MTDAPDLFDRRLRALRRDRAARGGPELFLNERAFAECVDRLADIPRHFDRALMVGVPDPDWVNRLAAHAATVDSLDPGALFAAAASGDQVEEDRHDFGSSRYDLVVAVGTLDTVNDLGPALAAIRRALRPDGAFIGALAGGDSLPALRRAMLAADCLTGPAAARSHPRIAPATLAGLLGAAGFVMPVVDVDRVVLRYPTLAALVRDLRAMGASNMLAQRAAPRGRAWAALAAAAFETEADETAEVEEPRTAERIDILHFLAWTAPLRTK